MTKKEKEEIKRMIEDGSIYEDPRYKKWRGRIYKRDGHSCQFPDCKWPMGSLNAHHIHMKWYNPELIFKLENGITLCQYHHKYIHKVGSDIFTPVFEDIAKKNIEKPKMSMRKAHKIKRTTKKAVKKQLRDNKKKGKKRVIRLVKIPGSLVRRI